MVLSPAFLGSCSFSAYSPEDIDSHTSLTAAQVLAERSDWKTTDNYQYDAIGNLTKDVKEGITNISWTVYGKIASITKEGNINLEYTYDAAGNRIENKYTKGTETHYTWYVCDAQGNTMAVYEKKGSTGTVRHTETHLKACPDEVRRRQQQAGHGKKN